MKNIFVSFLELLEVRHTKQFSSQYFNEHPHKYNLFGLSKMLRDYGVENVATRIQEKENDISEIQTPFIAQFSGDFVAVHKVDAKNVSFQWKGAPHDLSVAKFIEAWTGIVLLAESSEKSIEPDYSKHRKTEQIELLKKISPETISYTQNSKLGLIILNLDELKEANKEDKLRGKLKELVENSDDDGNDIYMLLSFK